MSLETYRRALEFNPNRAVGGAAPSAAVTTHRGRSLEEARANAVRELGPDFTVLATRRIPREGVFGFFGAEEYEVTALKKASAGPEPAPTQKHPFAQLASAAPKPETDEIQAFRNEVRHEVRSLRSLIARTSQEGPTESEKLRRGLETELAELRELLAEITNEKEAPAQSKRKIAALGIEGGAARALLTRLRAAKAPASDEAIAKAIRDVVRVAPWPLDGAGRSLVALVGPTGVGKTTTAAKLAAHAILTQDRSVTLVSSDGFRVGATEQMERYAELLGAELRVVRTPSEVDEAVAKSTTDVVIVDTGGRGPTEKNSIEGSIPRLKLGGRQRGATSHTLLCVPACTRDADARRIQRFFAACNPTALVMTKLDETATPAGIVHAALAGDLPIAALCFGQRVPEDIAPATTDGILEVLFGEKRARKAQS